MDSSYRYNRDGERNKVFISASSIFYSKEEMEIRGDKEVSKQIVFVLNKIKPNIEPDYRKMRVDEIRSSCELYIAKYKNTRSAKRKTSLSISAAILRSLKALESYEHISDYIHTLATFRDLYNNYSNAEILRIIVKY